MVESMSATAERVKAYEHKYGKEEVETFLDAVLAIQEHIDPSLMRPKLAWSIDDLEEEVEKKKVSQYDDLWNLDDRNKKRERSNIHKKKKIPPQPEKDLLLFIEEYSRELEDWRRDILTMMREEMLYFWPRLETKIMNEGWASYWHQRILREMDLTSDEAIEFAKLNAGVVQPSKQALTHTTLGLKCLKILKNGTTIRLKK